MNWKLAISVTAVGLTVAITGLAVAKFDSASISSLLLNLGVAIALIALVVAIQPRLLREVRRVTEDIASDVVGHATQDIRERVQRLEDLEREEAEERVRRLDVDRQRADQLLDAVTPETVGALLVAALDSNRFDHDRFKVRTSERPDGHVIYMLPLKTGNGSTPAMWLDFQPLEMSDQLDPKSRIRLPVRGESTVMWVSELASKIAGELEAGLERRNLPRLDFSFAYALDRLLKSDEVMSRSRSAGDPSPLRLRGCLRLLINDRWAYTSYGLEATEGFSAFSITARSLVSGTGMRVRDLFPKLEPCKRPESEPEDQWAEAISWLRDREGVTIVDVDDAASDS